MSEERKMSSVIREVLAVVRKELITPNYMRIVFGGDEIQKYKKVTVGINNKLFFPPKGVEEIHFPNFNEEVQPPENVRPIVRTYTCRALDLGKNEMTVDFALHGEEGIASAWAINCKIGDKIGVAMKDLKLELYPEADWYLLAGDATAIPVLSVILETLPENAKGLAFIEVQTKDDELPIETKSQIGIRWIHNPNPGKTSQLQDAVRNVLLPRNEDIKKFAYIAAEFEAVRNLRQFLRKENEWKADELNAYAYWKLGVAEDKSVRERHEEKHED